MKRGKKIKVPKRGWEIRQDEVIYSPRSHTLGTFEVQYSDSMRMCVCVHILNYLHFRLS